MTTITFEDIPNLKCMNCKYYRFDEYRIKTKRHKCCYASKYGKSIFGKVLNVNSNTPNFCPFITDEDMVINKGVELTEKIERKERYLEKAKQNCIKLTAELERLRKELEEVNASAEK